MDNLVRSVCDAYEKGYTSTENESPFKAQTYQNYAWEYGVTKGLFAKAKLEVENNGTQCTVSCGKTAKDADTLQGVPSFSQKCTY